MKKGKKKQLCHNVADNMNIVRLLEDVFTEQCANLGIERPKTFEYNLTIKVDDEEHTSEKEITFLR